MIQPLRTLHWRAFVALGLVLPAILVAGLAFRRPRQQLSVPAAQLPASANLVKKSETLWQKHTIQSQFYRDSNRPGETYIVLYPAQEANEPDLLLYWSTDQPQGDSLPAHPRLLGPFMKAKAFILPANIERTGYLVLFSLPHHTVFDIARIESLP
jgi:hypothetical protein